MSIDFAKRFDKRAADYSKYRPTYPRQVLDILRAETGFSKSTIVADIGSGTGLLSRLFLENGNRVFGVEPNDEMRAFAEQSLSKYSPFVSVKGRAENTGLQGANFDLIAVGQALHWFDQQATVKEFARILRNSGYVCILYNDRNKEDPFMQDYEAIITRHEKDRASVPEIDKGYLSKFFEDGKYKKFTLRNEQTLTLDGLLGRITSASYMPTSDDAERFIRMRDDVLRLFETSQKGGNVTLLYDTSMFLGQIQRGA